MIAAQRAAGEAFFATLKEQLEAVGALPALPAAKAALVALMQTTKSAAAAISIISLMARFSLGYCGILTFDPDPSIKASRRGGRQIGPVLA